MSYFVRGRPLEIGETVSLVSFHRGNKYIHGDVLEARYCGTVFCATDETDKGQWEIVSREYGGTQYGESQFYSVDRSELSGAYGPEELRRWIDNLRAIANPVWLVSASFCPIYRQLSATDFYAICDDTEDRIIRALNDSTDHGRAYDLQALNFKFQLPLRKRTGKPYPHGWDGDALVGWLYDYLSGGRKAQTIAKKDVCALTGFDDATIAAFIDNGAAPLAAANETAFDCMQLAKFLAHAFTNCWNGFAFVWGHQWKMEKSKKRGAVRIAGEDWHEVDYRARGSGVYLLFKGTSLKYVGESSCVMQRVAAHYSNPDWGDFDRALYMPVDAHKRRAMEKHYTRELCPQFDPHRYGARN